MKDYILGQDTFNTIKRSMTHTVPLANIAETDKLHSISISAPGMEKKDFSIDLDANKLIIKGQKSNSELNENEKCVRKEFNFDSFERVFTLPKNSDTKKINATYVNGILEITIPKKAEEIKKNRTILIE